MIKRILFYLGISTFFNLLLAASVRAVCPVCTVVVCGGVGLSRWLGIDDLISGVWVGGLMVSIIAWSIDWLEKKHIKFKFRRVIISVFFYVITIIPLYWSEIMGHPFNKIFGLDKLLVGIIIGSVVFLAGVLFNEFLKKRNRGKVFFPFQKVLLPTLSLLAASVIMWWIC